MDGDSPGARVWLVVSRSAIINDPQCVGTEAARKTGIFEEFHKVAKVALFSHCVAACVNNRVKESEQIVALRVQRRDRFGLACSGLHVAVDESAGEAKGGRADVNCLCVSYCCSPTTVARAFLTPRTKGSPSIPAGHYP